MTQADNRELLSTNSSLSVDNVRAGSRFLSRFCTEDFRGRNKFGNLATYVLRFQKPEPMTDAEFNLGLSTALLLQGHMMPRFESILNTHDQGKHAVFRQYAVSHILEYLEAFAALLVCRVPVSSGVLLAAVQHVAPLYDVLEE